MKKKRKYRKLKFPVIGKYIDTPTRSELKVLYFMGDAGNYKLTMGNLSNITLKSCRFQIKHSDAKSHRRFYNKLKHFLAFSSGFQELEQPLSPQFIPLLFGLLKLRKGKKHMFVLIQSADQYMQSKIVNISAVVVDNLLYLELVNKIKNKD